MGHLALDSFFKIYLNVIDLLVMIKNAINFKGLAKVELKISMVYWTLVW